MASGHTSLPRWTWIWLLWLPAALLRALYRDELEALYEDYEDDILVVTDVYGRETVYLSDRLAERDVPGPHVAWNARKWAEIDAALEAPFAWTPAADGVQHVLLFRLKTGTAISGFMPAPAILDSS